MFKKLGIRKSLYAGAVLVVCLSLGLGAATVYSIHLGSQALSTVYESKVMPASSLGEMDDLLKELRFRMAGYVLDQMPAVGNNNQLQETRMKTPTLWADFKEKMGAQSGEGQELVAKIDSEIPQLTSFLGKLETAYSRDDKASVSVLLEDEWPVVHMSLLKPLEKLVQMQQSGIKVTYDDTRAQANRLLVAMGGILALVLATVAFFAIFFVRVVTKPIHKAIDIADRVAAGDLSGKIEVEENKTETGRLMQALKAMSENLYRLASDVRSGAESITTAAKEIAVGNSDLSQRTEEQASSLEETASSMEELTATVKQNAENSKQANQLAGTASDIALKGGDIVGRVVLTMGRIEESSQKIVDIISVIEGIAFQTNILALNAAVEAARAGEQGRGFAVVAGEVRSLAQRSAAAAKEIKGLIDDSVSRVGEGTKLVQEAGKTMDEIVQSVKRVTDIIAEIAAASDEQSSGIEQVNQAITQMDEVTQQNAALVEEAAAASVSLEEQAARLNQSVSVFKLTADEAEVGADGAEENELAMAAPVQEAPRRKARALTVPRKRAVNGSGKVLHGGARAPVPAHHGGNDSDWKEF